MDHGMGTECGECTPRQVTESHNPFWLEFPPSLEYHLRTQGLVGPSLDWASSQDSAEGPSRAGSAARAQAPAKCDRMASQLGSPCPALSSSRQMTCDREVLGSMQRSQEHTHSFPSSCARVTFTMLSPRLREASWQALQERTACPVARHPKSSPCSIPITSHTARNGKPKHDQIKPGRSTCLRGWRHELNSQWSFHW